jgi:hypothetical protein
MILLIYLIIGYFMVRYIHKNILKVPNIGTGLIVMLAWPVVVPLFYINYKKINLTDLFFGKGKK